MCTCELRKALLEWVMQKFKRKESECKFIKFCVSELSIFVLLFLFYQIHCLSDACLSGRRVSECKFIKTLCVRVS